MHRAPNKYLYHQDCATAAIAKRRENQSSVFTARDPPLAPRFEILPETGLGAEYERRRGPTLLDLSKY